jgi:hypothetical protein
VSNSTTRPEEHIEYPVLMFGRDVLTIARTEWDLLTCTTKVVENGYFRGLTLVDASSRLLRVKDARIVGRLGILHGWPFYNSRQVKIHLEIERVEPMPLPEVKNLVRAAIGRNLHSFSAGYADRAELEAVLRDAPSVEALAEALR